MSDSKYEKQRQEPNQNGSFISTDGSSVNREAVTPSGMGMKWYKALSRALIWVFAAGCVITSIFWLQFSSSYSDLVPELRITCIVMFIIYLLSALLAVPAGICLIRMKRSGLLLLLLHHVLPAAGIIFYLMMVEYMIPGGILDSAFLGTWILLISEIVLLLINIFYFNKRKHLFS